VWGVVGDPAGQYARAVKEQQCCRQARPRLPPLSLVSQPRGGRQGREVVVVPPPSRCLQRLFYSGERDARSALSDRHGALPARGASVWSRASAR